MKKVILFDEEELAELRMAIIESIVKTSKEEGWGVKFISRDRDAEELAMRGHLVFCIDRVWPG